MKILKCSNFYIHWMNLVIKYSSSGLMIYRLVGRHSNTVHFVQSSLRLFFKNGKPEAIGGNHRLLTYVTIHYCNIYTFISMMSLKRGRWICSTGEENFSKIQIHFLRWHSPSVSENISRYTEFFQLFRARWLPHLSWRRFSFQWDSFFNSTSDSELTSGVERKVLPVFYNLN